MFKAFKKLSDQGFKKKCTILNFEGATRAFVRLKAVFLKQNNRRVPYLISEGFLSNTEGRNIMLDK